MSIAIRVNGRRRSQPPVGPFTVTITQSNMSGESMNFCYISPDGGTTQYHTTGDTFTATILYCKAWFGPVNTVVFDGVSQILTASGECSITLIGNCNVTMTGHGVGEGVDIVITTV